MSVDSLNLSAMLGELAGEHRVPGAALTVRLRGATTSVVTGCDRHEGGRPVTTATRFPIASVTKAVTATLVMVLAADGDLDLDEPIGPHVPQLREHPVAAATPRQLLSHTGGLAAAGATDPAHTASPLRYLVEHARSTDLVLPPGSGFSYSNAGYVLAGHLISDVTGMSWAEAVRTVLLTPLGIRPAFVVGAGPGEEDFAPGHVVGGLDGRTRPVRQTLSAAEAAAGALALSADDLVSFARLHTEAAAADPDLDGLLPAATARAMREPAPAAEPYGLAAGWGPGLAAFTDGGPPWWGHDGTGDGTSAHLRIQPEQDAVVALVTNASTGAALWRALVGELRALGVPVADQGPPPSGPSHPPPAECVGSYRNGATEYLVGDDGDQLSLAVDGVAVAVLRLRPDLGFTMHDTVSAGPPHEGRFLRDPVTGRVDRLQVTGRLASRAAPAAAPAHQP
ncbi:serine hydrolase domain-containing protein [Actinokineospora spheciospongiae]|uniref:serine hydrolase domain-containing protein n=1 Tax=Actinokineospora spheciospongiae TaxID=909613 RepID=UPI0009FE9BC0|nr:serine hydrolase domain-containing protein [Actinokineospora spheciospongiae]